MRVLTHPSPYRTTMQPQPDRELAVLLLILWIFGPLLAAGISLFVLWFLIKSAVYHGVSRAIRETAPRR